MNQAGVPESLLQRDGIVGIGELSVLCMASFLVALSYGAGLPLLQPYLGALQDAPAPTDVSWHVGTLGAVYMFSLFMFSPWWGRLSDSRGRVVVLQAGFLTFLIGTSVVAFSSSLLVAYVGRVLSGMGAAAIIPAAQAYIADRSSPDERGKRFVLIGSVTFLGLLSGPALGSWLAGPVMDMPVGNMPSMLPWPFFLILLVGVPVLLLMPRLLRSASPENRARLDHSVSRQPWRRRFLLVSMLLAVLVSFAIGAFDVGFNLFGTQVLRFGSDVIAVMFIVCSVAMLGAQWLLVSPWIRQHLDHRGIAALFALAAVALALAPFAPGATALGLLIVVVATSAGMVTPVLSYELLERDKAATGLVLGRQAAAGNLGQAIGALTAGVLYQAGPSVPFWFAAGVLLAGGLLAVSIWGSARAEEIRCCAAEGSR